jgi:hypothetical protein
MGADRINGRLTGKQTRRIWRCLDKIAGNYPTNPMDVAARSRMADENREAARQLANACYDAAEEMGAEIVNEYIGEAEDTLGLDRA